MRWIDLGNGKWGLGPVSWSSALGVWNTTLGGEMHVRGNTISLGAVSVQVSELTPSTQALQAEVSKVNNIAKNAVVSGTATPGAKVSIGSQEVDAHATTGAWSITVPNLAVGANNLTVIQKINGTEHDRKTVTATIVDGGTVIPENTPDVTLERDADTNVDVTVKTTEARTNPDATIEFTAPEGTTFANADDRAVQYRLPDGAWATSAYLKMRDGQLSENDTKLTYDVSGNGFNVAADSLIRFTVPVATPEGASAGRSDVGYVFAGDSPQGDFRAQGGTTTTIEAAAAADITATSPSGRAGETSSKGTAKVQAEKVVGPMTLTAPTGTTFAEANVRRMSDDGDQGNYRVTFNADRTVVTIDGPSNGSGAFWGTDHQYVDYTLAIPRSTAPGTISDGTAKVVADGTTLAEGTFGVDVDEAAVEALEVTTPANGSTVDTKRPVFSGTGDEGATIEVRSKAGRLIAETTVTDGKWSVPASFDLNDEQYVVDVFQKPLQGAATQTEVTFTVASSPFTTELTARGEFDRDVTKPANITGDATTGATVIVKDSLGNEVGRTEAVDGGYTIPVPPSSAHTGVNEFTVTQTKNGETSPAKDVSLDYGTPAPIRITSPTDNSTVQKQGLTFTGTGDEGARVEIRGNVRAIATGTVQNGAWTAPVNLDLSNNVYNLRGVQTTKGGLTTDQPITITITDEAPAAPLTATARFNTTDENLPAQMTGTANPGATITIRDGKGDIVNTGQADNAGAYTVLIPADKAHFGVNEFTVTQTVRGQLSPELERSLDYGTPAAPVIQTPDNGATVVNGQIRFTGTGATGAKLDMRGNTSSVGATTVADGAWAVNVTRQLNPAVYDLHALQTSKGGLTKRADITVTVQNEAPIAPLTADARFNPADENRPAQITGSANPGATVSVKDSDGVVIGTATAVDGRYTITIPANRAHFGVNDFTVTQTNKGEVSPALNRSLDYGNPAAPVIQTPDNGATVVNGQIRFTGTGATGADLDMRGNTSSVGSTKVADGAWTVDVTRVLTPNVYALHALQTSKGGLTKRADITVTIENEQVTALTATGTIDPDDVEKNATISGNAQTGADVIVREGTTVLESVKAVDGKYSVEIAATVEGVRTFTVTQTVKGEVSAPKTATLDYGTPAALVIETPDNGGTLRGDQVVFTGTGAPGAKVVLSGTSSRLGSATVNGQGAWTISVERTLSAQDYTLFTKQISKGNMNSPADQRTITVTR